MSSDNFIDYVKICCRSGHGGAGSRHFRREKFMPKGGPDGGDGGRGGHIVMRGNSQLWTLLHLKYRKHIIASHGQPGGAQRSTGADGEDIILEVPIGTVAIDAETEQVIGEITEDGEEVMLAKGGQGGLGNDHFKTATNQTPRYAQPGEEGIERWVVLELKLLADVGLVGLPNAGKSTLLSAVSAARPKIADYAFTTLKPNLGMVSYYDHRSFVMADIPGIIEGAHEGRGLGHRFLRHIERNSVLLFVIAADSEDCGAVYRLLLDELRAFEQGLMHKPRLIGISKIDLIDEEIQTWIQASLPEDIPHVFFSAVTQQGIQELKDKLWSMINEEE